MIMNMLPIVVKMNLIGVRIKQTTHTMMRDDELVTNNVAIDF